MSLPPLDETHDRHATSWAPGADGSGPFPVQNLPFCCFSTGDLGPRAGVAVGDVIVDLGAWLAACDSPQDAALADLCEGPLNALLAAGAEPRRALRRRLFALLTDPGARGELEPFLVPAAEAELHLPCEVGDYTDFYAGIHHARRVGRLFRPDSPLPPNYPWVPLAYHGRASTVVVSGTPVTRPWGQIPDTPGPRFGPTARLDFEFELAIWIGPGNPHGRPIPIAEAADHVAGFGILNDWSARDIQAWEYQPLGPFLAKSFATSVSAFVVTPEALAPFRAAALPRGPDDPLPLPYLADPADQTAGGLDLVLETYLSSRRMRAEGVPDVRIARTTSRHLWWTPAQLVAHHTSNGCQLRPGDLLGTGTISGPEPDEGGSLLELAEAGARPIALPTGETRAFLEDGDRVRLVASAQRPGFRSIGLGECWGEVVG
ncbi:MAG: fumarylacetoacetase [Sphingomonadaceae bacterium]|uniref:fumarylacetoacetase n=1 Tax=Thermaurantiacus sp. TaxID=2820283 RepID=UPI00298F0705|nr:fumarylacetoacetase [Thermaurantiacus sp.]MCS6986039.1 fumarylacetoacetase [Sphingomonadaceae bacterium]MDW8414745.1 fumarylacetoacetase [Thermaurantiacus sp.]